MGDKKEILVYPVSGSEWDIDWIENSKWADTISEADIVVFPGGADVNPELYGFRKHSSTYCSSYCDNRDIAAFKAMRPDQLAVGICRGAQFLCVANGGKLIQDVEGHAIGYTHEISEILDGHILSSSKKLQTSSLHHQMMYPYNLPKTAYDMKYVSFRGSCFKGADLAKDGSRLDITAFEQWGEPEVVVFHHNGPVSLAIQGHPEMMRRDCIFVKEMNNIINNLLNK